MLAVMQMQAAIADHSAVPLISLGDRVVYKGEWRGVFTVRKMADWQGHFLLRCESYIQGDTRDPRVWASRDEFEPAATSPNRGTLEMGKAGRGQLFRF